MMHILKNIFKVALVFSFVLPIGCAPAAGQEGSGVSQSILNFEETLRQVIDNTEGSIRSCRSVQYTDFNQPFQLSELFINEIGNPPESAFIAIIRLESSPTETLAHIKSISFFDDNEDYLKIPPYSDIKIEIDKFLYRYILFLYENKIDEIRSVLGSDCESGGFDLPIWHSGHIRFDD